MDRQEERERERKIDQEGEEQMEWNDKLML